jgi:hypothetical protein
MQTRLLFLCPEFSFPHSTSISGFMAMINMHQVSQNVEIPLLMWRFANNENLHFHL